MGLFGTVYCEYPLPDTQHQDLDFQTKDLERTLDEYIITRDGRLVRRAQRGEWGGRGLDRDIEWPLHGDVSIYTSQDSVWIEYVVRFTHGRVEWIRPKEEARHGLGLLPPDREPLPEPVIRPPALPMEAGSDAGPEEALLLNLRRNRHEFQKLFEESSSHWGYEDPVYRFYHQSFKVYWLQEQTQAIVDRLQALAPDLPLNPWFVHIVELGTGKEFKPEDNTHWTEVTRPILEAFFHPGSSSKWRCAMRTCPRRPASAERVRGTPGIVWDPVGSLRQPPRPGVGRPRVSDSGRDSLAEG